MTPTLPDSAIVETSIIDLTNAFRGKNKLSAVKSNAALTAVARAYATYLAKSGKFSHTADGREASERISSGGYQWCEVGENLASFLDSRGFTSIDLAKSSVEGWINSPGHRKNLLAEFVTETGVGVVKVPLDTPKYIAVQLFARPHTLEYQFQVSNVSKLPVTYLFGGDTQTLEPSSAIRHTSCYPSALVFDSAGKGEKKTTLNARIDAENGANYLLKPDATRTITIETGKLEKISE